MKKANQYKALLLLAAIGACKAADAQLYIGDAKFVTKANALVFVNGDVINDAPSNVQTVDHQGLLEMKGNWYNRSVTDKKVFTDASAGTVLLSGALQTFNGSNTTFPNLTLAGTQLKRQFTTIEIMDTLDLTDRELDVNGNTAGVLSNAVAAVKYDKGGYVNTTVSNNGWLVRNMNENTMYVFPLGNNNASGYRFRPLEVKAETAGNISGQFQNYNPSNDSYIASAKADDVNTVNDYWYHALKTDVAAGNNVAVGIPYNSITDGENTTIIKWDVNKRQWQLVPSVGPANINQYATDDNIFRTSENVMLNTTSTPLHLGTVRHAGGIHIPNVITPNGDGSNDTWIIKNLPAGVLMDLTIFNRWGNQVYYSRNYDNKWDGNGLNGGTYYYVLKLKTPGVSTKDAIYKGYILLVR